MRYFGSNDQASWRRIGQCASLPHRQIAEIDGANTFFLNTHYIICLGAGEVPDAEKQIYDTALEGISQLREGLHPQYNLAEEYAFIEKVYQKVDTLANSLARNVGSEWDQYRGAYTRYLAALNEEAQLAQGLTAEQQQQIQQAQQSLEDSFQLSAFEDPKVLLPIVFGALAIGGMIIYRRQRKGV